MGFSDVLKKLAGLTDEGYQDDMDAREGYEDYNEEGYDNENDIYSYDENNRQVEYRSSERTTGNIVGIATGGRSQVVFRKLEKFDEVAPVADVLKERKIVILNLETCPNEEAKRVIDFLYGVAYAISGDIKRVAGRAYIITPNNVPVTGELLDEIGNSTSTN